MRFTLVLCFTLAASGAAMADDCCIDGQSNPWKPYNTGVKWENPPTAAAAADRTDPLKLARVQSWDALFKSSLERARKEKKLVLLFQLVGELDLEGC
jgi:hypothetical protein